MKNGIVRRALSHLVSVALLLLGTPIRAQSSASYEADVEALSEAMSDVQAVKDLLDRPAFDLEDLGFELFFAEADEIIAWVTENIAYQPYAGLLRGAQGTLLARAGNSLDQAVLLAHLLNEAGYEARIALGQLTDEQAQQLLELTAVPAARDYTELKERLIEVAGEDSAALFDTLADPARLGVSAELSEQLIAALAGAGHELGSEQPWLIGEAADYAWVEYQLAGDSWKAVHTAAPFLTGVDLATEAWLEGSVPPELQHRVRFEVLVEALEGDELKVSPIMPAWERPAANAVGVVIDYANVPNTADMDTDLKTVLEQSEFWVPTFMGGMPDGAQAFDMLGAILSPEDAANPMAGVFRNVRGSFLDAVSALGGMTGGDAGEPLALTAQWLVVTLVAPDGTEREFRRTVFDRVGEDARAAGLTTVDAMTAEEAELRLLGQHRLMIFPGALPTDYLIDRFLEQLLASQPLLERALALQHGVTPQRKLEEALSETSPVEHLLTMHLFDQGPAGTLSWRAEPGLLMFSDWLAGTPEESVIVSSLDIMNNARRTMGSENAAVALNQGVFETLTERDLLGDQVHNAANHTGELTVYAPFSEAPAALGEEARANLQRDLDHGYAVLLPGEAEAWWRVDLATGETLGVTADGRGQSLTEYTIMLYDNAFTLMFAVKSYNDCTTGGLSWEAELCCLARAHISNIFGLGLGSALGGLGGAVLGGVAGGLMGLSFGLTSGFLGTDFSDLVPGGVCPA